MKKLVIVIHGGESFNSYEEYISFLRKVKLGDLVELSKKDWKKRLGADLPKNYQVINLEMPSKLNAKYIEWEIYFKLVDKIINNDSIIIGHSLGALFILKYLTENVSSKLFDKALFVACPFNSIKKEYNITDFFFDQNELSNIKNSVKNIIFFQSFDDPYLNKNDIIKFSELLPNAEIVLDESCGHYNGNKYLQILNKITS